MIDQVFPAAVWSVTPELCNLTSGVVGMASFKDCEGLSLDIPLGSLSGSWFEKRKSRISSFERAYGYAQNGDHITLLDLTETGCGFSCGGFPKENWRAQCALVSRSAFFETDPVVVSACVSMDGLFEWVRDNPIKGIDRYGKDGALHDTEFFVSAEDLHETVLCDVGDVSVALSPKVDIKSYSPLFKTQSMSSDYQLVFRFSNPICLHDAMFSVIVPFRDLLSLLMGFRAEILEVSFNFSEDSGEINYYAPLIGSAATDHPERAYREMPFPKVVVSDLLQALAGSWFALNSDAKRASRQVLEALIYKQNVEMGARFVALAGAFEALSRVGHKTQELTDEEFERRLACVESDIKDKKVRNWARRKLKYSNFVSAGLLANDMLNELEPFTSWLVPDVEKFKREHRASRNAYIHQTEGLRDSDCLGGFDLYHHTNAVFLIAYAKLMSLLGISPDELVRGLKSSRYRSFAVRKIQQMYSKPSVE